MKTNVSLYLVGERSTLRAIDSLTRTLVSCHFPNFFGSRARPAAARRGEGDACGPWPLAGGQTPFYILYTHTARDGVAKVHCKARTRRNSADRYYLFATCVATTHRHHAAPQPDGIYLPIHAKSLIYAGPADPNTVFRLCECLNEYSAYLTCSSSRAVTTSGRYTTMAVMSSL